MHDRRKKRVERAEIEFDDGYNPPSPPINFARLKVFGISMLGYSMREFRFLSIVELLGQYEEYCAVKGIKITSPADPDYDEYVIPSEVV